MDINAIMAYALKFSEQSSQAVQSQLNVSKGINSPEEMLKLQFAFQQYSTFLGCTSAVLKSVKDLIGSIVAKL